VGPVLTTEVGVGGVSIKGMFPTGPVVCPVEAEIQQLVLAVRRSHQLLSVLRPTRVTYVPCAKVVILSYTVPGPVRQFAPTSTTKKAPLGVDVARIGAEVGGADVTVLVGGCNV